MRMIVLAAGQGKRLRPLTDDRPKAMVPFLGRPLLDWTLSAARENGVDDIVVIGGWRSDRIVVPQIQVITNPDYAVTSMVGSLMVAEPWFGEEFVMSYGDIVYRPEVLRAVLASKAEIGVVVDVDWLPYWEKRFGDPLRDAESLRMTPEGVIRSIGRTVERLEDVQAQYIGLVVFRGRGVKALRRAWIRAKTDASYRRPILGHRNALDLLAMTDVLDELTSGDVPVTAIPIHGGWAEIDSPDDIAVGEERWN
jgi:L-glutamine-phosphate cytidylyltransferase